MAATASKANSVSSSSFLTSGRQNSRSRNSEAIDPMRRSFGDNPFSKPSISPNPRGLNNPNPTPANTPSDFPRRSSISRDNTHSLPDFMDKENERGQTPNLARVLPTPKGTKNFMSPTISAASKMNPSPRRKILTEKNEHARPSVSFADVISIIGADNELMSQTGRNQKTELEAPQHDITITDLDPKDAFESNVALVPNETVIIEETGCFDFDPNFKISPCPPVSDSYRYHSVAPVDADPLMPPYDPKRNYLSPRPRFLHYKPNPKIELYLNEGKQLEEIFAPESSPDTEASEMETDSENSEKQLEDVSHGTESEKEEEKVDEEEHEQEQTEKETAEGKEATKTRLGWILLLAVACFAILATISPSMELSVLKDSSFCDFYVSTEITEFAKANFEQLGEKLKTWSESSSFYIQNLVSSLGDVKKIGPLQFHNLTDSFEDGSFDSGFHLTRAEEIVAEPNHSGIKIDESSENGIDEDDDEMEYEEPMVVEEEEIGGENNLEVFSEEDGASATCEFQQQVAAELIETDKKQQETEAKADSDVGFEIERSEESTTGLDDMIVTDELSQAVIQAPETHEEIAENIIGPEVKFAAKASESENEISPGLESCKAEIDLEESRSKDSQSTVLKLYSSPSVLGLSLTILALLTAIAFFFAKKSEPIAPNSAALPSDYSPVSVENLINEKLSLMNFRTEVDTMEEYCPSDISSSFLKNNSSVYRKKGLQEPSEAESHEGKCNRRNNNGNDSFRRESFASSASEYSMDSQSYGSFTTYEKIPSKNGHGDEEVITPVRRSSRLRNQASSAH